MKQPSILLPSSAASLLGSYFVAALAFQRPLSLSRLEDNAQNVAPGLNYHRIPLRPRFMVEYRRKNASGRARTGDRRPASRALVERYSSLYRMQLSDFSQL